VTYGYGTQIVEIEIDRETGQVRVKRVWAAHDVGHAVNPMQVEGQIQGAISQAQGLTLLEDFIVENGYLKTKSYKDYMIPTVHDMPDEILPLIVEVPEPQGAYGIRGRGEMPMPMLAPATGCHSRRVRDLVQQAAGEGGRTY
jgi:CO/xanthine dehydrogenase Mo-binding subunit